MTPEEWSIQFEESLGLRCVENDHEFYPWKIEISSPRRVYKVHCVGALLTELYRKFRFRMSSDIVRDIAIQQCDGAVIYRRVEEKYYSGYSDHIAFKTKDNGDRFIEVFSCAAFEEMYNQ